MAINLGRVGIVPKGDYVIGGTYKFLDIVRFNSSSYLCKAQTTTSTPTNTTDWMLLTTNEGIQGANGSTWLSGTSPTGGVDGDYYFKTDTYDIYKKVADSWGSPIANIKGATGATGSQGIKGDTGDTGAQGIQGVAGLDGSTWLSGTSPTGGVDGDYYFKTDTCDIYKKVSGSWGSPIANIKGADGAGGGGSPTYTIQNKTAAYTVVAGDLGTIINCTANSFTVSLTSAETLGAGFHCSIWNSSNTSTHVITIDPAGTETIDGITTLVLRRGEGFGVVSDGTKWKIDNRNPMRGYAENLDSIIARPAASGGDSVAICSNASASGVSSFAAGGYSLSSGVSSFAMGSAVSAIGNYSFAGGFRSKATQTGKYAFGSGFFSVSGDAQTGIMVLRAATTTMPVILTSDGTAASTANQLILASGQAMAIQGTLIAKQQSSGNMAGWNISGIVSNNGGTMAVSGLALTAIGTDSIVLDAAPTITVDNTNKGVTITSGAKSATNIRWVATLNTSEVTY
jgi:hypothetical protein